MNSENAEFGPIKKRIGMNDREQESEQKLKPIQFSLIINHWMAYYDLQHIAAYLLMMWFDFKK